MHRGYLTAEVFFSNTVSGNKTWEEDSYNIDKNRQSYMILLLAVGPDQSKEVVNFSRHKMQVGASGVRQLLGLVSFLFLRKLPGAGEHFPHSVAALLPHMHCRAMGVVHYVSRT